MVFMILMQVPKAARAAAMSVVIVGEAVGEAEVVVMIVMSIASVRLLRHGDSLVRPAMALVTAGRISSIGSPVCLVITSKCSAAHCS